MAIRVGVFGAGGRMGATVCQAVAADPDLELVAAVENIAQLVRETAELTEGLYQPRYTLPK